MAEPIALDPLAGLVRRTGQGDRAAAEQLVRALSPKAFRIAWRMLRDAGEAEDVTQEALVRIWKATAEWRPGQARFETWMHRVVTNLCFDRLRRSGRFIDEGEVPEAADEAPHAEAAIVARDAQAEVDAAIAALPDRQRAALTLVHFEGCSALEAGEVLGVGVEAVESLLARARRSLRLRLVERKTEMLTALAAGGMR